MGIGTTSACQLCVLFVLVWSSLSLLIAFQKGGTLKRWHPKDLTVVHSYVVSTAHIVRVQQPSASA